jgi:FtsZ-binding cell division protein ZapB
MTEGSLWEVLDMLITNPNDGAVTLSVNAMKEIRDELRNAEGTIGRLMLEINRLNGDISTLAQEHTSMRARNERLEAESIHDLSDEEIEEFAEMMADLYNMAMSKMSCSRGYSEQCDVMEAILRAILKKASEK